MPDPVDDTRNWLEQVVVGLNLCPFAALPLRTDRVRIVSSDAPDEESLLADLQRELQRLDSGPGVDTTLLVITKLLSRFSEFNQFLDLAEALVVACGLEGRFQIASFHPDYRFAGSRPDDRGNLTNRSPWPVLHILSEQSVSEALAKHPQPEDIYKRNIRVLESLEDSEVRALFSWLQ